MYHDGEHSTEKIRISFLLSVTRHFSQKQHFTRYHSKTKKIKHEMINILTISNFNAIKSLTNVD